MTQQPTPQTTRDNRFWLGIGLLLIGAFWLLDEINLIPDGIAYYIFSWRTLLIVLGVYFIAGREKVSQGLILITLGVFFWLARLNLFIFQWDLFLPGLVILIGISLIAGRRFKNREESSDDSSKQDFIDDFAILGGRERTIDSQSFRGGKVTAMFGGSQIDFRNADLAPGEHVIDVFIMFGGSSLIIPPDWTVRVEVFSLLGGFSDKRYSTLKVIPNPEKTLVIKGFVMFGGGEISLTH
jgi:predicted membrane protein